MHNRWKILNQNKRQPVEHYTWSHFHVALSFVFLTRPTPAIKKTIPSMPYMAIDLKAKVFSPPRIKKYAEAISPAIPRIVRSIPMTRFSIVIFGFRVKITCQKTGQASTPATDFSDRLPATESSIMAAPSAIAMLAMALI